MALITFSLLIHHGFFVKETSATDIEALPFKQMLNIPIDTSFDEAKFQPIDMHVQFLHPCWAKNETVNSIRIAYDDGSGLAEIESQVYDLEFSDESHVEACSLVFLIPAEANRKEKYYVLYDDSEVPPADYVDHLTIEDTHYYYEPISGQKIDFDYYKILEDGYIVYGVLQKGMILGNGVSHTVLKIKPNSTEFETVNGEQFASFAMTYSIDGTQEETGSDWAKEISKAIIVDGNLMIRFRIEGVSPEDAIKTDNIYTYYYCPTATKRMNANVNHEVLQTVEIGGNMEQGGTYAHLTTFKSRSATIENMNVGYILPSLHIYGEDSIIKEYSIPTDPTSEREEWILSTTDDNDVGDKAWICVDDISTGKAHGLIFQSNTGFLEEEDGLQVKMYVKQEVKLPGLDADIGGVYATRNAYEAGGKYNTVLPKGMNVTFNAEFITFNTEGYEGVDKESEFYQKLIKHRPVFRGNVSKEEEKETYGLTTYVHLASSFPLGSTLSAVLGKNISYIYAELYRENVLTSSGSVGRLPLSEDMELEFENTTLIQKVKIVLGLFDWKNASLFKKIHFPNLEAGKYLIKIFRENPIGSGEHQYIGFKAVELTDNVSTHIVTGPEGAIELSIMNQNGGGVDKVKFSLVDDNVIVAEEFSDKNGSVVLKAPNYPLKAYTMRMIYQGFLVEEKTIHLDHRIRMFSRNNGFNMSLYLLEISVKDTWGFPPAIEMNPTLIGDGMIEPASLIANELTDGNYLFHDLYPAEYTLKMNYKSFSLEENIPIIENMMKEVIFPAEFEVTVNIFNSYGMKLRNGELLVSREGKITTTPINNEGKAIFSVPPGEYEIKTISDDNEVSREKIDVKGTKTINIVTTESSLLHKLIYFFGIGIIIASILFTLWKRKWCMGIQLFSVGIVLTALVSSWWTLKGSQGGVSTLTKTLVVPSKMMTKTSSYNVLGGAISSVPQEFTMVLSVLAALLIAAAILIVLSIVLRYKFKKISAVLSIVSILALIITIVLFAYAMSQVTKVGVGGFRGDGDLEIAMPGIHESVTLPCSWGPESGFYLSILAIVCLIGAFVYKSGGNMFTKCKKCAKSIVTRIRKLKLKKSSN